MSKFSLRLHATGRPSIDEPLDALDEVEARELARVRLLLTRDYSAVDLSRDGAPIGVFTRDAPRP